MIRDVSKILVAALVVGWMLTALPSVPAADSLRVREEQAFKAALARVAPSVVRIETVGGLERIGRMLVGTGPTTGLIVSSDGYIVSSAFNFAQQPASILVTLEGGSRRAAKLVATDHSRMLVLLKVDADGELAVPETAPKVEMRVGQWALAVGRAFEGGQPNVSVGIISALNRIWGKAIQTDAKISPNNYGGPLVDIQGRVLGVLVPMSPEGTGEVAGVEWYDSGIGFAVPLEDVQHALEKLKQGQDVRPGVLGVNLKGADMYSEPAIIAVARAKGPAYQAGFRAGDKIVEVAGVPVTRPAELKQALGPFYAGETVRVVAERGDARVDREVELVDEIEPYEYPFLGMLPMRFAAGAADGGLVVRYVYPDGPAAAAGIEPGDRILAIAGKEVKDTSAAVEELLVLAPGESVKLEVGRNGQTLLLEAQLATLPESLPGELPPAHATLPADEGERPAVGVVSIKVPEFANECVAYVPEAYRADVAHGVVLWLHPPGGFKPDELIERWKPLCDKHELILVAPQSTDGAAWRTTDLRYVRRALDEVTKRYTTDPSRIVVHGQEGGGALAYVFAVASADVVRGVAVVDAPLPRIVQLPETNPVNRLAIYTTLATKSELAPAVEAGVERLREMKYPVTVNDVGEQGRYLTADELAALARWIDSLDRL